MSLCKDCVTGVRHEGTPEGKIETVNGVKVYIATPKVDYPKDKALLFLTDVFGLDLINNQLLADDFARNGFYTIIPDYLNGDPLAPDAFSKPDFNIADWFKNHMAEQTRPPLDKVIAWLKGNGVKEFAATGYCFGARYVFDLAFDGFIKASVVSHPSLLNVEEDMGKYVKEVKAPLLINSCTHDTQFPLEAQAKTDAIFADEKAPLYKRVYFGGCTHGFAVRGDLKDPKVKAGKEGAFRAAVEWFMEYM
ncbi:Protein AIM2 [Leucoagaricus sp. SymC.cos]|nr:Protein AIM2 [Leucoagaricus sp. SymC.cos]